MTVAVSISLYGCFLHQLFNFTDTYDLRLAGNLRHAGSGQIYDSIDADILIFQEKAEEEEEEIIINDTTYVDEEEHMTDVTAPRESSFVVPTSDVGINVERDNGELKTSVTFTPMDGDYMLMTSCAYSEGTQQLQTLREDKITRENMTKFIDPDRVRVMSHRAITWHGVSYEFYPNGQMKHEKNGIDGENEGYEKGYYESGGLESLVMFVAGEKEGREFFYREDGRLKSHVDYVKGDYIQRVTYNTDGSIDEVKVYE